MTDKKDVAETSKGKNFYAEQYANTVKQGTVKEISVTYHSFEKDGGMLVGRLLYSETKNNDDTGREYYSHVLETDEGIKNIIPGSMVDSILKTSDYTDKILAIEFLGKDKIAGGKTYNKYKVEVVPG